MLQIPPTVYPTNIHRLSHLAPPEKGRNEWLCRGESGANLEGSNTCRERAPQSGQVEVKLLLSTHQEAMPRGGNRGAIGLERASHALLWGLLPLGLATPSGCGGVHKWRV